MKILYLLFLCVLTATTASAQNIMVVENKDNTTTEFNVDDIQRVYFKNNGGGGEINPSNTVLSCRLKDQNENTVLLEGIQKDNGNWSVKYEYDEKGVLKKIMEGDDVTLVFNGMSFTTTYSVHDGGKDYAMTIEAELSLNERGFITEMAIKMKQLTKEGTLILEADFSYQFSYNTDGQMVRFGRGKLNGKQFDDLGSQINTLDQEPREIMEFIWENGNMVKTVVVGKREYTKKYGSEVNITRQNTYERIFDETQGGYTGCSAMHLIGLLGVGTANFQQERTFTLNPNGTIATEDSYTYIYK